MFGYITPAFPMLSGEDRAIWQSFYCTLCREIGKISHIARLGLSFDMTFLSVLICALSEDAPKCEKKRRCLMHPTKKTDVFLHEEAFSYTANASVILIKEKLKDDAKDEKSMLSSFGGRIIKDGIGLEDLKDEIASSLARLAKAEKENNLDIDEVADCFAVLCGKMFELSPAPNAEKRKLYWLGYNLGRWIYLQDAWDDLEKDIKKGSYNPFSDGRSFSEIRTATAERVEEMLSFTLAEASLAYDLLNVKRYNSILENIIYAGLPQRLEEVMKGKQRNESIRSSGRESER